MVTIRSRCGTRAREVSRASSPPAASTAASTPPGASARTRPSSPAPYVTGSAPNSRSHGVAALARGADHPRARVRRQLHRHQADAARGAVDQDRVPGADPDDGQRVHRRRAGQHHPARLLERQRRAAWASRWRRAPPRRRRTRPRSGTRPPHRRPGSEPAGPSAAAGAPRSPPRRPRTPGASAAAPDPAPWRRCTPCSRSGSCPPPAPRSAPGPGPAGRPASRSPTAPRARRSAVATTALVIAAPPRRAGRARLSVPRISRPWPAARCGTGRGS